MAIAREYHQQRAILQEHEDAMPHVPMEPLFEVPEPEDVRRWGGIKETSFPFQPGRSILESGIRLEDSEAGTSLLERASNKLAEAEYPAEVLDSFRVVFMELIRNAFEHGCRKGEDKVYILVDIDPYKTSLVVVNPPGVVFNLESSIRRQRLALARNDMRPRGRGLLLVRELSDDLRSVQNGNAVKAVLERIPVILDVTTDGGVAVIFVQSGVHNDSLERRITELVHQYLDHDLVIEFPRAKRRPGTWGISVIIRLAGLCRKHGRKLVAVANDYGAFVPGALRAPSRAAAISRLKELRDKTPQA
jgi:anti-sigma regulatory factor (Ser/Thr protein kinase)